MTKGLKSNVFLIVCGTRTGGDLLSSCLDSHPETFCHRGEPLLWRSAVRQSFPDGNGEKWLHVYLAGDNWPAVGAKVVYGQARRYPDALTYVQSRGGRFVHLTRQDYLGAVVSVLMRKMAKKQVGVKVPSHTLKPFAKPRVEIDPRQLLSGMRARRKLENTYRRDLPSRGPVFEVDYHDLTGGEEVVALPEEVAGRLCEFLGVEPHPLRTPLRKGNRWPLREIIDNWETVREAVGESEFADLLEGR